MRVAITAKHWPRALIGMWLLNACAAGSGTDANDRVEATGMPRTDGATGAGYAAHGGAAEPREVGSSTAYAYARSQPSYEPALDASTANAEFESEASSASDASADPNTPVRLPPFEAYGEPLRAYPGRWEYTEFPDTHCRDGSPAGVYTSLGDSKKLALVLEGGGLCLSEATCLINADNMQHPLVALGGLMIQTGSGLFDRDNADNPLRDWNIVYVPYCTGDTMVGANPDAYVTRVGPQMFVGRTNLEKFLDRVVPTFHDATQVLVTGSSAGGFAAIFNAVLIQRAFPGVKVQMIDDSGPLLTHTAIATCRQSQQRALWNLDDTVLADCGGACPNRSDFYHDYAMFLARAFSDRPSGLISWTDDQVIRTYLGTSETTARGA